VKFSFRQILASAAGAVIAALIASSFGVTGTIIGVAIGSMAATLGTALVSQSIERGQKVVKQAVVRVPDGPTSTLLRRVGGTGAAGAASSSVDGGSSAPVPTEVAGGVDEEATEMQPAAPVDATERVPMAADIEDHAPVTESFEAETVPLLPTAVLEGAGVVGVTGGQGVATTAATDGQARGRRFTWKAFAGTAAIVFVLALGFVTAIELIANRPTVFTPSSPAPSNTTTTTSTPSTTTSTSTGSATSSTTTSTTGPSSATTSTTAPSTTTTTNLKSTTTTTTTTTTAGP
jgi:hypothetical protein